jgi:hypothetical protein
VGPTKRRFLFPFLALAALVGLTSCLKVTLVEDYDAVIDQGLHSYDESINSFLNRMERVNEEDAGSYSKNPEIPKFYAEQLGKLEALEDRAEVLGGRECLPALWGSEGLEWLLNQTMDVMEDYKDERLVDDVYVGLRELKDQEPDSFKDKSCTQIVLQVVVANHRLLELIHKDEDRFVAEVASPARGLVRQGIRIAMRNETGKKRD